MTSESKKVEIHIELSDIENAWSEPFTNIANEDLRTVRDLTYTLSRGAIEPDHHSTPFSDTYIRSNSPITISNAGGSRSGSGSGSGSGSDSFYGTIQENESDSDNSHEDEPMSISGEQRSKNRIWQISTGTRDDRNWISHPPDPQLQWVDVSTNNNSPTLHNNPTLLSRRRRASDHRKYRQLNYHQIEQSLDRYYDNNECKHASELDILITYLKGQKHIFIHSKHITQCKLNWIMIPALLITALLTVFAPFMERYSWSGGFISALNAIIALLISTNNYLRLESATELYLQLANQYDKLETSLEMASNKLPFLDKTMDKTALVLSKIKEVETKMAEIKETNRFLLPDEITQYFPIICHINIFSFIKHMEIHKKELIMRFRDVKNEIRYILYKWKWDQYESLDQLSSAAEPDTIDHTKEQNRLALLYEVKAKLQTEIMYYRKAYGNMDDIFTKEIKMAGQQKIGCVNNHLENRFRGINPVIDNYFNIIF